MKLLVLCFILGLSLVSAVPHQYGHHQSSDELFGEFMNSEEGSTKTSPENSNVFQKYMNNIISFMKNVGEESKNKVAQLLGREPRTEISTETDVSGNRFSFTDIFTRLRDFLVHNADPEKFKELVEKLLPKSKMMAKSILDIFKKYGEKGRDVLIDFFDRYLPNRRTSPIESDSMEKRERETSAQGEFQPRIRTTYS